MDEDTDANSLSGNGGLMACQALIIPKRTNRTTTIWRSLKPYHTSHAEAQSALQGTWRLPSVGAMFTSFFLNASFKTYQPRLAKACRIVVRWFARKPRVNVNGAFMNNLSSQIATLLRALASRRLYSLTGRYALVGVIWGALVLQPGARGFIESAQTYCFEMLTDVRVVGDAFGFRTILVVAAVVTMPWTGRPGRRIAHDALSALSIAFAFTAGFWLICAATFAAYTYDAPLVDNVSAWMAAFSVSLMGLASHVEWLRMRVAKSLSANVREDSPTICADQAGRVRISIPDIP